MNTIYNYLPAEAIDSMVQRVIRHKRLFNGMFNNGLASHKDNQLNLDDMCQEAHLKLLRSRYTPNGNPLSYVSKVITNHFIDIARLKGRNIHLESNMVWNDEEQDFREMEIADTYFPNGLDALLAREDKGENIFKERDKIA